MRINQRLSSSMNINADVIYTSYLYSAHHIMELHSLSMYYDEPIIGGGSLCSLSSNV
jgi:hypothetical protein